MGNDAQLDARVLQMSGEYIWLFPLIMMGLCIFMMSRGGMCGMRRRSRDSAKHNQQSSKEPPMETLNRRYALGEIGKVEYEEKKAAITQDTSSKYQLSA